MRKKLIRELQKAHAGEIAAYFAYDGHWKSAKSLSDKSAILSIQMEEMEHILVTKKYLAILGARSSRNRDALFYIIGRIASALCYIAGERLPLIGARLIETIGVTNYKEMVLLAAEENFPNMALKFQHMAQAEKAHERFFRERLEWKSNN